ncbi:hypothetical protein DSCA_22780 [Desulfosarcina alkanivorans]|uniref:Uncharacterized protein n=1 Tax=Desulfosarcina alkanivorans TaxID=571177 RepID=A0A5K7YH28_9BACT|nr:aspartate/glutamate racemase family protein [Desulfosarcina alkanivorans]BBO68348.1 hypothetical protein DSCA_22780 [Desulfosarcina alkanivorans]
MNQLPDKENLTLLVTDSGLGGLSICAHMVRHLTRQCLFRDLSVVYFNAWPLQDKGYNFLDGDAQRIRVFGNAISRMDRYDPDLIFIACNTLSLVFRQGALAAGARAPVVDIIDFGVEMIAGQLNRHPQSTALILGTRTTVAAGAHKKRLMERGIAGHRIAQQDCHGLAGAIESDPDSPQVRALVERFMSRAAAAIDPGTDHIFAALCCTHYGYIRPLIREILVRHTGATVDIIDPNRAMSDWVCVEGAENRFSSVNLDVRVVSRVRLPAQKINAIAARVASVSPQTARALRDYRHIPDLFDV